MTIALAQATASSSADAGGGSIIGSVIWLAITVALIVGAWKLFTKAGQPGWASLIPIYNTITMLRMTGKSGWWVLGMMVPLLNFYVIIRLVFDLARVFGRGIGFGFGLLFLFPIFMLILAFGDAVYVGPNGTYGAPAPAGGFVKAPTAP
jgi:hypothetical protein